MGDDDVANNTFGVNPRGGEVERGVSVEAFTERLANEVAEMNPEIVGAAIAGAVAYDPARRLIRR